jgi:hypothetical protein
MPEGEMEKHSLQGSVLFHREHSPAQRRRHQLSPMRSEELRSLRQEANEMQREEVGLVYDPVPKQLILVVMSGPVRRHSAIDKPRDLLGILAQPYEV